MAANLSLIAYFLYNFVQMSHQAHNKNLS